MSVEFRFPENHGDLLDAWVRSSISERGELGRIEERVNECGRIMRGRSSIALEQEEERQQGEQADHGRTDTRQARAGEALLEAGGDCLIRPESQIDNATNPR